MNVRDIMTTNVVTIPSSTSIADAKRIMEAHRIRRLPVVDKGKLVGIVTERRLESVSPSKAISLTVWELSYLLDKTPVREVMALWWWLRITGWWVYQLPTTSSIR